MKSLLEEVIVWFVKWFSVWPGLIVYGLIRPLSLIPIVWIYLVWLFLLASHVLQLVSVGMLVPFFSVGFTCMAPVGFYDSSEDWTSFPIVIWSMQETLFNFSWKWPSLVVVGLIPKVGMVRGSNPSYRSDFLPCT